MTENPNNPDSTTGVAGSTDKHPNPTSLLELAAKVEAATGPDEGLWGLIVLATGCCKDTDPTASLDAAMTLADGFLIVALSDIAADGLTGCCICSDTASNPPKEHWGIPAESGPRREVMARAITAAALKARAHAD